MACRGRKQTAPTPDSPRISRSPCEAGTRERLRSVWYVVRIALPGSADTTGRSHARRRSSSLERDAASSLASSTGWATAPIGASRTRMWAVPIWHIGYILRAGAHYLPDVVHALPAGLDGEQMQVLAIDGVVPYGTTALIDRMSLI